MIQLVSLSLLELSFYIDAGKIHASLTKGQRHRQQRQLSESAPSFNENMFAVCNHREPATCENFLNRLASSGREYQMLMMALAPQYVQFHNPTSIFTLQATGLFDQKTNTFTPDGLSAMALDHINPMMLFLSGLLSQQAVTLEKLLEAKYLDTFNQTYILNAAGCLAVLANHILPQQLSRLGLYPLNLSGLSVDILVQAKYVNKYCFATALGNLAIHIGYLPSNFGFSLHCFDSEEPQLSVSDLQLANYVSQTAPLLTALGLAAMQSHYLSQDTLAALGIYPFGAVPDNTDPNTPTDLPFQNYTLKVEDLILAGYLSGRNYLLTITALHAIEHKYMNIDEFRKLNIWPCPINPTIGAFISAGYVSYRGHLTRLGSALYRLHYFHPETLVSIGVHMNNNFAIFHRSMVDDGLFQTPYHHFHTEPTVLISGPTQQVSKLRKTFE